MITILFNNVDLEPYFRIKDIRGRGLIQRKVNGITVTGMPGEHLASIDELSKYLEIDIRIVNKKLRETIDNLNEIFSTDEPVPIIFPDEPDKTYYGTVETSAESGEKLHLHRHDSTILIRRSDPFKYGPEQNSIIPDTAIIENNGTAEADPIFTMNVLEPTTFAMISNGEEYMMVGRPYEVNETPFQKYERVFYSNASSLVGWTTHDVVDGGIVAGSMESNGTRFQTANYGTGTSWHGPAIKHSLPEVLTDFRLEAFVGYFNKNVPAYVGRIEIYLLDINGNQVAKLAIKDTQSGQALAVGEARAGDISNNHFIINETGDRAGVWNDFSGIMRIEREGNDWYAYIGMVDTSTGLHHSRRVARWKDTNNRFTRKVAQVVVHMGQYGSHQTTTGGVYSINIDKINQQQSDNIPYIADVGDKVLFDHKTGDCYINGEPVPFDFGADFFKLNKGENGLAVLPEATFETSVKFREKYR